jgi:hypothetical protein
MNTSVDVSYLGLRKWIGLLGLVMPVVVWGISRYDGLPAHVYDTISAHYYTRARDIFVGTMALVGVLIYFYRSPHPWDNRIARVCGVAAVLIGLLPIDPPEGVEADLTTTLARHLHSYPVTLFFASGIYLVGVSFRKTSLKQAAGQAPLHNETARELEVGHPRKRLRNLIYMGCAVVMTLGSLALAAANVLTEQFNWTEGWRFVPETAAVMAFAFAWLVKGQTWTFVRDPDVDSPQAVPQVTPVRE